MYQGKLPKSLAELNAEAMGVSDAPQTIMENFHEALMARSAKRIEKAKAEPALPIDEEQAFLDELTRFYAQEMAQAMLSPSDLQSIDEQKSRELYRYRKLVYFISTKPLKMETFDAEVRDIQGTIEAIGTAVAGARAERKRQAAAAKQQRQASMGALTGFLEKQKGKDLKQYTGTEWIEVMTILGGLR